VTPGTAAIERVALRWLLDVLGLPPECAGAFVTGTTVAHITALAAARHAVLARAGWNVEADGLFGAPPITVVVGAEAHPTLFKALGVVGLGRNRVVRVPVDGQGRMRVDGLPRLTGPTIVCVQAGNVNTGAFDPVSEISEYARASKAWVHVDGAFGLWARVAPSRAHLMAGIEHADSWATDGHKWLNVPYDSGIAFVRDGEALQASMAITAEYLPTASEHRNPSDYTPELSRRARGVEVWAALRSLGRSANASTASILPRTSSSWTSSYCSMAVERGKSVSSRIQLPLFQRIERGGALRLAPASPVPLRTGTTNRTTPLSVRASTSTSTSKKPVRVSRACTSRALTIRRFAARS